jgi:hypothetical protein
MSIGRIVTRAGVARDKGWSFSSPKIFEEEVLYRVLGKIIRCLLRHSMRRGTISVLAFSVELTRLKM